MKNWNSSASRKVPCGQSCSAKMQIWNNRTRPTRTCAKDSNKRSWLLSNGHERVKALEGQQAKDSHNSSLPPSSERLVGAPKSLRQKSGKKPGGQPGHRGHHLQQVEIPDAVLVHPVERCERCQEDLHTQPAAQPEHRQVFDLPPQRLWVTEHRVEEKQCPTCFHLTRASCPILVKAPAQYGTGSAALAVSLVSSQSVPHARASKLLRDLLR